MSKRELEALNGTGDYDGSRHNKRRREAGGSSSDVDVLMSDPIEPVGVNGAGDVEQVKEQGLKIWQTVKDATKDDVFLRKPSKRLYPDYYVLIKKPIALEDIKKSLENNAYTSLEAVKSDFETLFGNAKEYNQPESIIYQDAKELWKLVQKTYHKMVPKDDDGKPKPPTLHRLLKTRLERLISKTDTEGRTLSTEFMQLPSRKLWAIYYKEIKNPQCFDNIFKRLKQKEYPTSATFASDVERVFSNALTFNQEHTQIWDDAMTLRDHFRQLMADLPPPHNLPEYTKPSNKIKIRPTQNAQPTASSSTLPIPKQESAGLTLRVPAQHTPKVAPKAPTPTPAAPEPSLPIAPVTAPRKIVAPVPKPATPQAQAAAKAPSKAPTPMPAMQQTISFVNATPSHYPRAPYVPPPMQVPSPAPLPAVVHPTPAVNVNAHSSSNSPAPVVFPPNHQLKAVDLRIQPTGRYLSLDHRDGVKSWALRLVPGETSVLVNKVSFMGDEEDEESSDDEDREEKNEEDEDMDMDVDVEGGGTVSPPSKNGRKKGKGRGRGRPPKAATLAAKAAQAAAAAKAAKEAKKKSAAKIGEVQLKLNKILVKEQSDQPGEWSVYLPVGPNTIEVGEIGGMIWKVYAERLGDA